MLELYKNIKKRRQELNMTQEQLAKKLGYADKSMIAKIEKGAVDLPLSKIELFAHALDTDPGMLMGDAWAGDILDNARLEVVKYLEGDVFEVAKFQEAEKEDYMKDTSVQPRTLAAHFDGKEFTEDEMNEIQKYAEFVKSRRKG